jgi:uncharacterized protein (TIGR02246 family)
MGEVAMNGKWIMCVSVLALSGLGTSAAADAAAAIEEANTQFESAFNAGDAASLADLYTADAVLLPPESEQVEGTEAIRAYWQAGIDAGLTDLDLVTGSVEESGDTAVETGRYSLTAPTQDGASEQATGKYMVLWQQADGGWKLHWDIWNMSPPEGSISPSE